MQFAISELIRAARVYKDDDHEDEDSWLNPADWLRLFNVEYAQLYPRWVRAGLIVPPYTDTPMTDITTVINNVLAIVGVARKDGNRYYPLEHLQPQLGHSPWLDTDAGNHSVGWVARGTGDNLTVELTPPPSDAGNYIVRYITRPAYFTSADDTVELPYGADERLVLGMADRAGIKDSTTSRKVSEKIFDADAQLNFLAFGRGGGPRVRRVNRYRLRNDRFASPFPDVRYWLFV